jgi:hypothetical protein
MLLLTRPNPLSLPLLLLRLLTLPLPPRLPLAGLLITSRYGRTLLNRRAMLRIVTTAILPTYPLRSRSSGAAAVSCYLPLSTLTIDRTTLRRLARRRRRCYCLLGQLQACSSSMAAY